jgi:hypothetical protein
VLRTRGGIQLRTERGHYGMQLSNPPLGVGTPNTRPLVMNAVSRQHSSITRDLDIGLLKIISRNLLLCDTSFLGVERL